MDTDLPLADELAAVFGRMSGLLLSAETVGTALELLTALAKETIPGTDGAGVTLLDEHGERVTAAATDTLVSDADNLQYSLGEGPCLTAWEQRSPVRVDDLASERRWPRWTSAAAVTGIRAVLSAPMVAGDEALGALKVYAHQPGTYIGREHLLAMFAAHAAVLLASVRSHQDVRRVSDELHNSMRTRDVVNMAKGVLMARDGVDEHGAFLLLTGMAREQGTPLAEVARSVTGTTTRRRR